MAQVNVVDSDIDISVLQGGGSTAQKYLDKFMKAIESYFHPANFGRWLVKLKDLLRKLPYYFIQRLHTLVE
jgi:proteasome activator subunit 4